MQKLIKRTAQAEKQAARRLKFEKRREARSEMGERKGSGRRLMSEVKEQRELARQVRREEWELGHLAPNRLEMRPQGNKTVYGSVGASRMHPEPNLLPHELDLIMAWCGGSKQTCLAIDDRVVVMEGLEKGKIGKVQDIDRRNGLLKVEGVSVTNMTIPEFAVEPGQPYVQPTQTYIPISAVRLVHPVTDPVTKITRDVIIRELRPTATAYDRVTRRGSYGRVVPGLNVKIPWPQNPPQAKEEHDVDTRRIDLEDKTFVPTLLKPPMPDAVINELRNRFSRFRTRHEPEYIAQKEAEAAEALARRKMADSMRTPLKEFHAAQRAERRARGQPVLSDEMLAQIGEVMERNQQVSLHSAGISEVRRAAVAAAVPVPPPEARRTQPLAP